jgi:predicted nucleotidyltransferase
MLSPAICHLVNATSWVSELEVPIVSSAALLNQEMARWVEQLTAACPAIREVWLLGSRANGTARPDSDWDLLVFGADAAGPCIKSHSELHRADVDLLLVDNTNGEFSRPWGNQKTGSLAGWEWKAVSEQVSTYRSVKWVPDEDPVPGADTGDIVVSRLNAYRVWPST